MANIQQHYQTCKDSQCPLFNANELNCSALKTGNCKYQTIHVLQDASEFNQELDGELHGIYRSWYWDDQLRVEINYKNGELHGIYKEWYEDGRLWHECNYVNGEKHGTYKEWDYDVMLGGNNIFEDGQLGMEINYVNGERHGICRIRKKWYSDELTDTVYINGKKRSWIYKFFYKLLKEFKA